MRTSIVSSVFAVFVATVIALYAQEPSSLVGFLRVEDESSNAALLFPDGANYQEMCDKVPLPQETPFDKEVQKRQQYIDSFRQGYIWASGHHFLCPTNPNGTNRHAIRGWIEG